MSVLVAKATGNLLDATVTWGLADSTSLLFNLNGTHSSTLLTTSYVASQTFTPGAITIDGIGVKLHSRAVSPSGTFSVELFNSTDAASVAGTEVTINVADLAAATASSVRDGGWIFFKFSAPVLLVAAKAYSVRAKTSVSSQVTLWRNATASNWLRFLRTTTEQAPVAGDNLVVARQYTGAGTHATDCVITMNSTAATDFGDATTNTNDCGLYIGDAQEFKFGNTASTNYIFRLSGNLIIAKGGTFSIGKTGAAIPRSGSAQLILDPASDGACKIEICNGATYNTLGESRTSGKSFSWTLITADISAAATSIPVLNDTGWLNGDTIVLAGSGTTFNQREVEILNGDAGASSMTVTGTISIARDADTPIKSEVILLTRNVQVKSQTSTNAFSIQCWDCAIDTKWTSYQHLGNSSPRGWDFNNVDSTTSQKTFQHCSFYDAELTPFYWNTTSFNLDNLLVDNCVFYGGDATSTNGMVLVGSQLFIPTDFIVTSNVCIGNNDTASSGFLIACVPTQFEGNRASGHGYGFEFSAVILLGGSFNANFAHSNYRAGVFHNGNNRGLRLTNWKIGRNGQIAGTAGANVLFEGNSRDLKHTGADIFGAVSANIIWFNTYSADIEFDTCNLENETGFTSAANVLIRDAGPVILDKIKFTNCKMDGSSGITNRVPHAIILNSDAATALLYGSIKFENCKTGTPTSSFMHANLKARFGSSFEVAVGYDNNTEGTHRTFKQAGEIRRNTSVFQTAAPSAEFIPRLAASKLEGAFTRAAVVSGDLIAFSAAVRKDGSYAGNAPRLMLRRVDALGITVDTVLDTLSVGANTWETLSGNTANASADGVYEAYVDCDGTAGSVFVDDVAAA